LFAAKRCAAENYPEKKESDWESSGRGLTKRVQHAFGEIERKGRIWGETFEERCREGGPTLGIPQA